MHRLLVVIVAHAATVSCNGLTKCPHDAARGTCLPGGHLSLSFNHTQPLKARQCVQVQRVAEAMCRGRPCVQRVAEPLCFCPRSGKTTQVGLQSRVLFDSLGKWVLKVSPRVGAAFNPQREACFLDRLQGTAWAPQLLCHSAIGVVYEAVGEPVSPHNLPRDWRAQTATMLTDLHARGIRHNDIWRPGRLNMNGLVPW